MAHKVAIGVYRADACGESPLPAQAIAVLLLEAH